MLSFLRNIMGCCSKRQKTEFLDVTGSSDICFKMEDDVVNILVPRYFFPYFAAYRPKEQNLSIQEMMHLFRYQVPCAVPYPGAEYEHSTYHFRADDKLFVIQGWVPRKDLVIKPRDMRSFSARDTNKCWKPADVKVIMEKTMRNVVCVDVHSRQITPAAYHQEMYVSWPDVRDLKFPTNTITNHYALNRADVKSWSSNLVRCSLNEQNRCTDIYRAKIKAVDCDYKPYMYFSKDAE